MTKLFLSKKAIIAVVLGLSLVGAGSASAGVLDFFKDRGARFWPQPQILDITVKSPNGGETWKAGETRTITWDIDEYAIQEWFDKFEGANEKRLENFPYPSNLQVLAYLINGGSPLPMLEGAPADMAVFAPSKRAHYIGRADLYTGQMNWTIPAYMHEGDDYKVRLAVVWGPMVHAETRDQVENMDFRYLPRVIASDESDNSFTILGDHDNPNVDELLEELNELRREVNSMRQKINNMGNIIDRMQRIIEGFMN